MNLLIRLFHLLSFVFFRPKLTYTGESVLYFRVWPHDLDFNMHMTNSRYLSLMDLGRVDFGLRSPLARPMMTGEWRAVVGASSIRFRKPLNLLQRFSLHTRLIGWDEKWAYFEQKVMSKGKLMTSALVKVLFLERQKPVATIHVLKTLEPHIILPLVNVSFAIQHWNEAEEALRSEHKKERKINEQ